MRNIKSAEKDARELLQMIEDFGRKNRVSLRDPMALMVETAGFTPPQLHSVMWIGTEGAITMGELAHRIGVTEKTITGVVDRLEAGGFAARERDAADRRVVRVVLTSKGQDAFEKISAEILKKTTWMLSLLDDEDRKALKRIVTNLMARVAEAGAALHAEEAQ